MSSFSGIFGGRFVGGIVRICFVGFGVGRFGVIILREHTLIFHIVGIFLLFFKFKQFFLGVQFSEIARSVALLVVGVELLQRLNIRVVRFGNVVVCFSF